MNEQIVAIRERIGKLRHQANGPLRDAYGYIHDALLYTPAENITESMMVALLVIMKIMVIKMTGHPTLDAKMLDDIRDTLEQQRFELAPQPEKQISHPSEE